MKRQPKSRGIIVDLIHNDPYMGWIRFFRKPHIKYFRTYDKLEKYLKTRHNIIDYKIIKVI